MELQRGEKFVLATNALQTLAERLERLMGLQQRLSDLGPRVGWELVFAAATTVTSALSLSLEV